MKRNRSDSATAAVEAARAVAAGPLQPPAHVQLRDGDQPFWDAIVCARERDTWNSVDLSKAANLARCQADIERITHELTTEKDVVVNSKGTRRAYLTMARKNSKTATIATILLVHLVGPEAKLNSHIQSGALSREQAGQVYKYASKIVTLSPELSGIVRIVPSSKKLIGLPMNVEYQAMSAEARTAHGGSPILAILDETGQVKGPQDDFIDAIETSQGASDDPLLIVISTQAASDADLLSIWLDDAEKSQDPHIVSHVYAADKEAGMMDKQAWKDANPALGMFRSLKDVEEQAKKATRIPSAENTFRNLILNQRVSTSKNRLAKRAHLQKSTAYRRKAKGSGHLLMRSA